MKLEPEVAILLDDARRGRFYGSIEFKFEAGKIVLIKRNETIKPTTNRDNREVADVDE